jgi:hypothetical protein
MHDLHAVKYSFLSGPTVAPCTRRYDLVTSHNLGKSFKDLTNYIEIPDVFFYKHRQGADSVLESRTRR